MRLAGAVLALALAGCAPPGPAAKLTIADIRSIVEPLALREVLGQTCGIPNTAVKTAFIADLKAAGASAELVGQAEAEADRIADLEREKPSEAVCTPEFIESTATMATFARLAWADLKKRKP